MANADYMIFDEMVERITKDAKEKMFFNETRCRSWGIFVNVDTSELADELGKATSIEVTDYKVVGLPQLPEPKQ